MKNEKTLKYYRVPFFFLMLISLLFVGCGGKPSLTVSIAGLPNVNPDSTGRPSPVLLKMYELSADSAFKQADMIALFTDPQLALGADLNSFDDITVLPGEATTVEYEPMLETRFIGVMASFRQISGKGSWKVLVPINPEKPNNIALEINSSSLVLIPLEQAKKWDPLAAIEKFKVSSTVVPQTTK